MTVSSKETLPELPSLTGLRFWAAYCILLNHLLIGFVARDNPYFKTMLSACGVLGMDTFFVLSGFIIHYNYHRKLADFTARSAYDFFVARFSRLYPLFICLFFLEIATTDTVQNIPHEDVWKSLPYFLTMSQSWFYHQMSNGASVVYMYPRVSIAWSISTEMLMYCSYPLLLWLFMRDRLSPRARFAIVAGVALAFSFWLRWLNNHMDMVDGWGVALFGPQAGVAANASFSFAVWLVFLSPYVRIFEFIIGAMSAHVFLKLLGKPVGIVEARLMPWIAVLSLAFIVATFLPAEYALPWVQTVYTTIGYYPFLAVIIFSCARYNFAAVTRFFLWWPFVRLGEYSYSIYLFHIFIYTAATHALSSGPIRILTIVMAWTTVFSCAYVLYTYIEMPLRKTVRRRMLVFWPAPATE